MADTSVNCSRWPGLATLALFPGLVAVLVSVAPGIAGAADRNQRKTTDYLLYAGWVDGYLTAMNQAGDDTFDYTPWQTTEFLLANLKAYCEGHPDTRFFGAVNAILASLRPERLTEYSETVSMGHRGHTVLVYRSILEKVVSALRRQGYLKASARDHGAITAALEAFQRDAGIPANGLPDARTLFTLFGKAGS